ncbi:sigma-70 family RNA polymerase sigma factor [Paenibacillus hamazuiensis]|uniref:sigma-70 family RNA polymerase sigma factor n=1 Tax=Paenibacillus hamazuiensis TaxID=2936508 RepID=UPI00200FA163|nr:sigma-70 family RNA polymerase sigma factor [Paenibacillus hamazuiensis]
MEEVNVHELLRRVAEGDETAFGQLYNETCQDVYRMVAFLIPDAHDAMEVANEVYVQLWKSLGSYDGSRPFRFWLHGIVAKLASNHRRSLWRKFRLFEKKKLSLAAAAGHSSLKDVESEDELLQLMMKLSRKLRTVLVLRYYQDYSFEEIAALLGVPVGTVKSRHHAAVEKLRKTWKNNQEDKAGDIHGVRTTNP